MSRLGFSGYAVNDPSGGGNLDGLLTATRDSTIIRNGFYSAKCNSGAGNSTIRVNIPGAAFGLAAGTNTTSVEFIRGYFYFSSSFPGTQTAIINHHQFSSSGPTILRIGVEIDSTGHLIVRAGDNTSSASSKVLSINTWYRIECKITYQTTSTPSAIATVNAVYVDGIDWSLTVTYTQNSSIGFSSTTPGLGWITAPGANTVCYISDTAWNDDQGANQNSYPGSGKVVLLLPTATSGSPAAKWTDNDGTQTNMWEGVNNTPPTGTAATTTPSHNYIKHAGGAAGTTDEFDATMTTYAAAGIGATDTINVIQYIVVTGEESATGTKLLALKGVSNPIIAQGNNFDVFATSGAQGTYPTNWQIKRDGLATQYNPSVTIASAPVFGVVRPETATRVASVCAMFMYVDYTPPTTPTVGSESDFIPAKSSQIVSVNRASFY